MKLKIWVVGLAAAAAFAVGYGAVALAAYPSPGDGYFDGQHDSNVGGGLVWSTNSGMKNCEGGDGLAIPNWVVSDYPGNMTPLEKADRYINYVFCKLNSSRAGGAYSDAIVRQDRTGAAFIISLTIGQKARNPSDAQKEEFTKRVRYAAQQGRMKFVNSLGCDPYRNVFGVPINTYYDDTHNDDAVLYDCGTLNKPAIIFENSDGTRFILKRYCANPVGQIPPIDPSPPAEFNLAPTVEVKITRDGVPVTGNDNNVAEPGDKATFTYKVLNSGAATSPVATCTYRQAMYSGYSEAPPASVVVPSGSNWTNTCPRTIPGTSAGPGLNNVIVATEVVDNLQDGKSYCRSLSVQPTSQANSGATAPSQACVHVVSKPFASVRGGDVSAGGGVATLANCGTANTDAAIIGWNRGAANSYQGAGVQYAAYALNAILGVATSAANGAGAAASPDGLSFANTTTDLPNEKYGGSFGSVPCIPDYYATLPGARNSIGSPASAAQASGVYFRGTGQDLVLTGGTIDPGNRVSVYVDGDVYISGSIMYGYGGGSSWASPDRIPLFRLIVRGNIYIAPSVSQLDGMYVAQSANGSSDGVIYTCATGLGTPVDLTSMSAGCGTQLVVNGGFAARQVRLMRTNGSLTSGSAAEVFNYSPALWISQPADISAGADWYDSIISLPPVL